VVADGLPGKEFQGRVALVMSRMGKRAVHTDAPDEYKDLYFREVLVDLPDQEELAINARVKVRIMVD
jgi:hypothetical protein